MDNNLFGDVISVYTRQQALEDGVLVDVSETAREAGFVYPVAVTQALWADIQDIPPSKKGWQDVQGRLWDVLWMARCAARSAKSDASQCLKYVLTMHVGRTSRYTVKLMCGPGDCGEPVITLMRPGED